jgi:hypothetical protein
MVALMLKHFMLMVMDSYQDSQQHLALWLYLEQQ